MLRRLIVLGATGDLAARYLLPALARLHELRELPEPFEIVGVSREPLDDAAYRARVADALKRHAADLAQESRDALPRMASYAEADVSDSARMAQLLQRSEEPPLVYLALPPAVYETAIRKTVCFASTIFSACRPSRIC